MSFDGDCFFLSGSRWLSKDGASSSMRKEQRDGKNALFSYLSSLLSLFISLSLSLSGSLSYQVSATLTLMILTLLSFLPWARSLLFELT